MPILHAPILEQAGFVSGALEPAKNYVYRLDGLTKYYQLSEAINLVGDFEIQLESFMVADDSNGIISSELDFNGFGGYYQLGAGRLVEGYYNTSEGIKKQTLLTNTISDGSLPALRLLRFVKLGATLTLHADGGAKVISDPAIDNIQTISRVGRFGGLYSGGYYKNLKIYTGGDKDAGILSHEIPLTNKDQGATQLATVGNVSATIINYTDTWEEV